MADDFLKISVDLGQLPSLMSRLRKLDNLRLGLAVGAQFLKGKLATYPPRNIVRVGVNMLRTDKQRRGFFAKLRAGEIDVPYRRGQSPGSERLGQRWTTEARDFGMTQVIGNNSSYAPLVQSAEKQALYHKVTGWKTEKQVLAENGPQAVRIALGYLGKDL